MDAIIFQASLLLWCLTVSYDQQSVDFPSPAEPSCAPIRIDTQYPDLHTRQILTPDTSP